MQYSSLRKDHEVTKLIKQKMDQQVPPLILTELQESMSPPLPQNQNQNQNYHSNSNSLSRPATTHHRRSIFSDGFLNNMNESSDNDTEKEMEPHFQSEHSQHTLPGTPHIIEEHHQNLASSQNPHKTLTPTIQSPNSHAPLNSHRLLLPTLNIPTTPTLGIPNSPSLQLLHSPIHTDRAPLPPIHSDDEDHDYSEQTLNSLAIPRDSGVKFHFSKAINEAEHNSDNPYLKMPEDPSVSEGLNVSESNLNNSEIDISNSNEDAQQQNTQYEPSNLNRVKSRGRASDPKQGPSVHDKLRNWHQKAIFKELEQQHLIKDKRHRAVIEIQQERVSGEFPRAMELELLEQSYPIILKACQYYHKYLGVKNPISILAVDRLRKMAKILNREPEL
eukprot:TRINITY_DN3807_c0_g1_i5.p1 TRINITY_DN3807_c0_g1~~TRINITY_DN3807_c0_g1_i5.p1  ORF type:complete len:388 (-),score=74.82 TRINITY_DN3807_c0_g1_i5:136-1299(-)